MQLGISTYTYPWAVGVPGYPPERPLRAIDLVEKAASLGAGVLQVADNLPLDSLSPAELAAFAAKARQLAIAIEVGTRGIAHDQLHAYLQLARYLDSSILRVVVDTAHSHPSDDEVVALISGFAPELEQAGVTLAVENHDRFTARRLARILERIGSEHVGVCLDTVNSLGALEGPEVVADCLAPWAVNLHIKDFTISRAGHMMGFLVTGRPAGQGRLDVPWLLGRIAEEGRDPDGILELWTPPEETIGETIAKEDAWASASVAYLRQFIPH